MSCSGMPGRIPQSLQSHAKLWLDAPQYQFRCRACTTVTQARIALSPSSLAHPRTLANARLCTSMWFASHSGQTSEIMTRTDRGLPLESFWRTSAQGGRMACKQVALQYGATWSSGCSLLPYGRSPTRLGAAWDVQTWLRATSQRLLGLNNLRRCGCTPHQLGRWA